MLTLIKAIFEKELSLADTVEQCEAIKRAYIGRNGIIKQLEGALWKR